jgi:hypothetical protein
MAVQAALVTEGCGEEALPSSAGACDDEIPVLGDPSAGGESQQLVFLQPPGEGPVDLFEGGPVAKTSEPQKPCKPTIVSLIPLGIHQVAEQLVGGELPLRSALHAGAEGPHHTVQLHLLHSLQGSLVVVHLDLLPFQL